jgi:anti-sigma factor RsiW
MESGRVNELDLLAYADGLLDSDPHHKAAVEAALRARPEYWARAQALRAQTDRLRAAYGWRLAEPVPERLVAVLERRPPPRAAWLPAAAAVMLTLTAGTAGWMIGQGSGPPVAEMPAAIRLTEASYSRFVTERPEAAGPVLALAPAPARPMDWLSDTLSIRLRAPDMSAAGYVLAGQSVATSDGERVVRLDYTGEEGRSFSLFLAPRWRADQQEISEIERGGVAIASWLKGPLASAIVTRMPAGEARELAEDVRRAMQTDGAAPAMLQPRLPTAPIGGSEAVADALAGPALNEPQTATPQPVSSTVAN